MKCPICGKELELKNKQIGTNENGDPIFNQYAICHDCKKQWNLDKQRAKRAAKKEAEKSASATPVSKEDIQQKKPAKIKDTPIKKPVSTEEAPLKKPAAKTAKEAPVKREPVKRAANEGDEPVKRPVKKRRPSSEEADRTTGDKVPAKKPVKKRHPEEGGQERKSAEEKRYSNIPSEKVRSKHAKAARKSYTEMLETGDISKKAKVSKKKPEPKIEPKTEEYDDEEYFDDDPRFRPVRVILAILSLIGFGYLIYRGFITGLADTTEGSVLSSGMTYIIVSLCMLVSALLYFIMLNKNTVFAFLLPMIFYLGGGIFAFLQKGDDIQLLISAVAAAVLAVISLILALTSRGGYDDEEDYDDAFEDDYADDDYEN